MPSGPADLLKSAATGGPAQRPLLAPLASAIAGEVQGLAPETFLRNVTKLANLVRDLTRSLGGDVAVAEFGTLWDAEARGVPLDWSRGFPPLPKGRLAPSPAADLASGGRAPVVCEAVRRLRALLGDEAVIGASVTGPVTLARLSGGAIAPAAAATLVLPAARLLCEAGARLVWVVEGPNPPDDPAALVAAMAPVWGTIRFYQGLGALHLAGAADGWRDFVAAGGPYLTCFDPDRSPRVADLFRGAQGTYGLALPPEEPSQAACELARNGRCRLVTHDGELAGRVPIRDLRNIVAALRSAVA